MANQLTEEQTVFFKEAYARFFDKDGDGTISQKEFSDNIRTMMVACGKPDDAVIQDLIARSEADSSGIMDFSKLLSLMAFKVELAGEPSPSRPSPRQRRDMTYSGAFMPVDDDDDDNIEIDS